MARTASFRSLVRLMTAAFLAERRHFLRETRATGSILTMGTIPGLPQPATAAKPSPSLLSDGSAYPNLLNVQLT